MFARIFQKLEESAAERGRAMLKTFGQELGQFTATIEGLVINGLDKSEDLDDDLVKDIEELHEKADALEAKIRAKLAPASTKAPEAEQL